MRSLIRKFDYNFCTKDGILDAYSVRVYNMVYKDIRAPLFVMEQRMYRDICMEMIGD